jgi:leucyl-tRNA synthetase
MPGYNPQAIEKKWQGRWAAAKTFATHASDHTKPKYYVLDMFPYPSGQGLHVGHPEGYTATDIVARYKRAKGFNVMHPMGWDAFGLPAEQYAIKNNVHPRETTANNINRFRAQLQSLGFSYDWDREVDTTDPNYYKWSQWIFLKLYDTWFDEEQQKGRPISDLIEEFKTGKRAIPANQNTSAPDGNPGPSPANWNTLSPTQQRQLLSHYRLAYEAEVPVNWCPGLGTVLANEEVIDGKSEVGGFPVERRPMKQWMLRITAYSERLINGLEKLEWSDSLKEMQRNWIGKSEGAEVQFEISNLKSQISNLKSQMLTVFTTRPDTLFGATYMVIAPEHPFVASLTATEQKDKVEAYRKWAANRSDRERQEDTRKTGEFTGSYAINPVNGKQIPIWISDYVLMGYGTGAIMAVPAHDDRDHEFATKFKLPIVQVVAPKNSLAPHGNAGDAAPNVQETAFTEEGVAVNSPWIEGLPTQEAKSKIISMLEEKKIGTRRVNYKIRDWLFSRQRYWGEPFPIVHLEDGTNVRLADDQLPLVLPELADFKPTGTIDPPLSKAGEWVNVHVTVDANQTARVVPAGTPGAVPARRELNTMPQWAGSCWYYIRYLDARNPAAFVNKDIEKYWLHNGVDLYVGGVEHAVLHLLYSRFWHKVLFDWGLVSNDEPFRRLVNQGLILGEAEFTLFKTEAGEPVSYENVDPEFDTRTATVDGREVNQTISKHKQTKQLLVGHGVDKDDVEKKGEGFVLKTDSAIRVDSRSFKMSKSRGNVVNPDDVIKEYGADALRLFEMFMGPLEQVKPWSTAGVEGVYRFLQRVWRNLFDENDASKIVEGASDPALIRAFHRLIKRVGDDIERLSFNTAIAAMMEFNNTVGESQRAGRQLDKSTAIGFLRLLEPFAPHFAEEAHSRLGQNASAGSISELPWPVCDPALLVDATIEIPVQVAGKLRGKITVPRDADEATVLSAALADPEVQKFLAGKEPKKKIYVKGRMVNLVV